MTAWEALVQGRLGRGTPALLRLCRDAFQTEWRFFLPLIFASLAAGLFAAVPPLIIAHLIDTAVAGSSIEIVSLAALGIVGAFAAVALADAGLTWCRHRWAIRSQINMRSRVVPQLLATGLRQPVLRLQDNSRASMIRSFDDLEETISFFTVTMPEFISSALLAASYATLLIIVNPLLAIISLTIALLAFSTTAVLAKRSHSAFAAWLIDRDRAFTLIVEAFASLLTIKTMNAHRALTSRFLSKLDAENVTLAGMRKATASAETASRGWMGFMPGIVVLFGLWMVGRGEVTVGELVLFLSVTSSLAAPVASLCLQWEAAERTLAAVGRISDLRASELEDLDTTGKKDWRPDNEIALDNVSHRYAGATGYALENVSFTLEKGVHVAVTGRSGGGKTTLAHILARLIEPTAGRVVTAGVSAGEIGLSPYRQRVLMLPHETDIFTTSIAMNIALWENTYSLHDIEVAADAAGLADVVRNLPDGYETFLAADGEPLSAGQLQRLGIARALLRQPDILILDEATSSLDPETEAIVMHGIRAAMHGRTLVVVTHREELAAAFPHRIFVADGRVSFAQEEPLPPRQRLKHGELASPVQGG